MGEEQQIDITDNERVVLVLKTLGLTCDGQYQVMQDFLRRQSSNIKTVNIVGEVAEFLNSLLYQSTIGIIVMHDLVYWIMLYEHASSNMHCFLMWVS